MPTATEVREQRVADRAEGWEAARVPRTQGVLQIPHLLLQRPLFADSLLDSDKQERNRRKFASILSFTFQCLLIGVLLMVPLMFTEALPQQQLLTFLVAPPPPPPPPPPAAEAVARVVRKREDEAPPPLPSTGGVVGGVPGGIPGGQLGGVIGGIVSQTSSLMVVPKLATATPKRIRISQGVTKGLLIQKIEPKYPLLALQARIWGEVILKAIITKDGEIKELELVSGHPMLTAAAIAAVRQWRFHPYLLNGEPIEVETTVTVTFKIS